MDQIAEPPLPSVIKNFLTFKKNMFGDRLGDLQWVIRVSSGPRP